MSIAIRRVVTGHEKKGNSIIQLDGSAQNVKLRKANGLISTLLWVEDQTPANNSDEIDKANREIGVAPPEGGSIFRVVEFTPDDETVSNEEMKIELGLEPNCDNPVRHPGMHRTRSLDYAIILSGEIDMLVDNDEVHLKSGDVVVQRGTNHAWANRGSSSCLIAFVLIDASNLPST